MLREFLFPVFETSPKLVVPVGVKAAGPFIKLPELLLLVVMKKEAALRVRVLDRKELIQTIATLLIVVDHALITSDPWEAHVLLDLLLRVLIRGEPLPRPWHHSVRKWPLKQTLLLRKNLGGSVSSATNKVISR